MNKLIKISIALTLLLLLLTSGCVNINTGIAYTSETEFGSVRSSAFSGNTIKVEGRNGSIIIVPWDKKYVEVEYEKKAESFISAGKLQGFLDNSSVVLTESDERITIQTQTPRITNGSVSIKMTIYIPNELDLDINTSNGSITFDKGLVGTAKLKTSNGSVNIVDYNGDLDVETSNGSITILEQQGSIKARTSNGSIKFQSEKSVGDVSLRTSNGRVEMALGELIGQRYEVRTSNGSVNVTLPKESGFNLDASSRSGRVNCDFTNSNDKSVTENVNGGGPDLVLETSNGTISIKKGN